MLYVLKKLYLSCSCCDDENQEKQFEMLDIVAHILKTNQKRNWDVIENKQFIMVRCHE
jgi:hypothetical protein